MVEERVDQGCPARATGRAERAEPGLLLVRTIVVTTNKAEHAMNNPLSPSHASGPAAISAGLVLRRSAARGHFNHGWLDTRHTFSFGQYQDAAWMGFRALRVINEDRIAPGQGFGEHPHDNMEIISYIPAGGGSLAHRDTLGTVQSLGPGEVQRMSAGSGLEHSEFNPSATQATHLIQIWLKPSVRNAAPTYDQRKFPIHEERNTLHLLVSPDARSGSMVIQQDALLSAASVDAGWSRDVAIAPGRHAWLQVVSGELALNSVALAAGDGVAVSNTQRLSLHAKAAAEFLLFDLT